MWDPRQGKTKWRITYCGRYASFFVYIRPYLLKEKKEMYVGRMLQECAYALLFSYLFFHWPSHNIYVWPIDRKERKGKLCWSEFYSWLIQWHTNVWSPQRLINDHHWSGQPRIISSNRYALLRSLASPYVTPNGLITSGEAIKTKIKGERTWCHVAGCYTCLASRCAATPVTTGRKKG